MQASTVIGIGIDLVENRRMRYLLTRWRRKFLDRVFLPEEQTYCESKASPWLHFAGRFAVKEAVTKAFGTGIHPGLTWLDILVTRDPDSGRPGVVFNGNARRLARERGVATALVSLSHTRDYTVAQALLLGEGPA